MYVRGQQVTAVPTATGGRKPYPLETMLRIDLLQNWLSLSDPTMEELYEITPIRQFARLTLSASYLRSHHDHDLPIFAEVDDMAMLRLLARDSGDVALLPAVVVQDELRTGALQLYLEIPEIVEQFFAVTQQRHFSLSILNELLKDN